jgi:hypothetical protein
MSEKSGFRSFVEKYGKIIALGGLLAKGEAKAEEIYVPPEMVEEVKGMSIDEIRDAVNKANYKKSQDQKSAREMAEREAGSKEDQEAYQKVRKALDTYENFMKVRFPAQADQKVRDMLTLTEKLDPKDALKTIEDELEKIGAILKQ